MYSFAKSMDVIMIFCLGQQVRCLVHLAQELWIYILFKILSIILRSR